MKKSNLIKRLEKEGYNITYEKVDYWDNIPVVKIGNSKLALESFIRNRDYNNFTINYYDNTTYKQVMERIDHIKNNCKEQYNLYYINTIAYEKGRKHIIEESFI